MNSFGADSDRFVPFESSCVLSSLFLFTVRKSLYEVNIGKVDIAPTNYMPNNNKVKFDLNP